MVLHRGFEQGTREGALTTECICIHDVTTHYSRPGAEGNPLIQVGSNILETILRLPFLSSFPWWRTPRMEKKENKERGHRTSNINKNRRNMLDHSITPCQVRALARCTERSTASFCAQMMQTYPDHCGRQRTCSAVVARGFPRFRVTPKVCAHSWRGRPYYYIILFFLDPQMA